MLNMTSNTSKKGQGPFFYFPAKPWSACECGAVHLLCAQLESAELLPEGPLGIPHPVGTAIPVGKLRQEDRHAYLTSFPVHAGPLSYWSLTKHNSKSK